MKKCLVIIHPHFTIPGGAGKVILEISRRLARNVKVVVFAQKINREYIKSYPNVEFISIDGPTTDSLKFWLFLLYWRKKYLLAINKIRRKYDTTLLANVFPANWIALPCKKRLEDTKTLWFCHEPSAFIHSPKWRRAIKNPLKRAAAHLLCPLFAAYDRKITRYADLIFANSLYTKKQIKQIYKRDSQVIYPGISPGDFRPLPYNQKDNLILSTGRLSKFKRFDIAIKAFSRLNKPGWKMVIVGEGEERMTLERLAQKSGLKSRIVFTGSVGDEKLTSLYQRAKIYLACAKDEPFGITPVEAMAAGAVVIADKSGGTKETVVNGKSGILIDCNEHNISEAINNLNEREAAMLSRGALQRAKKFSWTQAARAIGSFL